MLRAALLCAALMMSGWGTVAAAEPPRQISVDGSAEIRVVPDEVVLTLGVESIDKNLAKAKGDNDRRVKRLLVATDSLGIPREDVRLEFLGIRPRHDRDDEGKTLDRYEVRRSVVITLGDVSKFEDLLTSAITAGGNYVHGVDFRTTELRRYRDQARKEAIKAAREKAEALAEELGTSIGKPLTISEGYSRWWSTYGSWWGDHWAQGPMQNVVQVEPGPETEEGPPPPGRIAVTATIHVVFALGR